MLLMPCVRRLQRSAAHGLLRLRGEHMGMLHWIGLEIGLDWQVPRDIKMALRRGRDQCSATVIVRSINMGTC